MGSSLIFLTEQAAPRLTVSGVSPTLTRLPDDLTITSNDYGAGPSGLQVFVPGSSEPVAATAQVAPCVGAGVQAPQNGAVDSPGAPHSGDRNHRCTAPLTLTVPSDDLPDGSYNITIKSQDIIGNEVVETRAVQIDREGPETDFSAAVSKGQNDDQPLPEGIDGYVNGQLASKLTAVSADEGSGVKNLKINKLVSAKSPLLANDDAADSDFEPVTTQLANVTKSCGVGTCNPTETLEKALEMLPQGLHTFSAVAADALGNENDTAVDMLVDTEGPTAPDPETISVIESDLLAGTTTVAWQDEMDTALPDGHPGSGNDFDEARYRIGGVLGQWSEWQGPLEDEEITISGLGVGLLPLDIQIRSVDAAGNRSRVSTEKNLGTGNKTQEGGRGNPSQPNVGVFRNCTVRTSDVPAQVGVIEGNAEYKDVLIRANSSVNCEKNEMSLLEVRFATCLKMRGRLREVPRRQVCDSRKAKPIDDNKYDLSIPLDIRCRSGDRKYLITSSMVVTIPESSRMTVLGKVDIGRQSTTIKIQSGEKEYRCPAVETWRFVAKHRVFDAKRYSEMEKISPARALRNGLISHGQPVPPIPSNIGTEGNPPRNMPSWAAHHMIPASEPKGAVSQGYGFVCGQSANTWSNGAWLRDRGLRTSEPAYKSIPTSPIDYRHRAYHGPNGGIHTPRYFNQVAIRIRYENFDDQRGDYIDFKGGGVNGGGTSPPTCDTRATSRRLRKRVRTKLYANTFPFRQNGLGDNDPLDPDD